MFNIISILICMFFIVTCGMMRDRPKGLQEVPELKIVGKPGSQIRKGVGKPWLEGGLGKAK